MPSMRRKINNLPDCPQCGARPQQKRLFRQGVFVRGVRCGNRRCAWGGHWTTAYNWASWTLSQDTGRDGKHLEATRPREIAAALS